MAVSMGFHWWQAVIISMVTVTSAGQLAGIGIMVNPGQYIEMLISQLTVNVRYSFMAISLSQKTDSKFRGIYRWLLGFFITDEIFAVASNEESVSRSFFTGLSLIPWLGWTMGTLTGALLGNILPDELMSALCIAIYGMFVAIIAPKAKKSLSLLIVVVIALAMSCIFYYAPVLKEISSGISISVCAILAALIGAFIFPVKEEAENG
ncbi:MAG: AzlC family ABC transporter permease [Ruminiclostridium sp.]|nr:AzlC family ABC transporter permease [Ruminiclostridium sp.]